MTPLFLHNPKSYKTLEEPQQFLLSLVKALRDNGWGVVIANSNEIYANKEFNIGRCNQYLEEYTFTVFPSRINYYKRIEGKKTKYNKKEKKYEEEKTSINTQHLIAQFKG